MKRTRSGSTGMTFAVAGGRVLTREELLRQVRKNAAVHDDPPLPEAPPAAEAREPSALDVEAVFDALAVAGSARGKTWVMQFLRASGHRTDRDTLLGHSEITQALHQLLSRGRIRSDEGHGHLVPAEAAALRMQVLLASGPRRPWWRWFAWAASRGALREGELPAWVDLRTADDRAAVVRLLVYAGATLDEYKQAMLGPLRSAAGVDVLLRATTQPFMAPLFERMDADLRQAVIAALDPVIGEAGVSPLHDWIEDRLAKAPHDVPAHLRFRIAERRLHALDLEGMHAALAGERGSSVLGLFAAAEHAVHGRWAEASSAFAVAHKALQAELGRRRGAAPFGLTWVYPLALLAQPDPAAWSAARKFCVTESGSRTPPAHDVWGRWAHAAAVRLGDVRLDAEAAIARYPYEEQKFSNPLSAAHRLLLAALLGAKPPNWRAPDIARLVQALVDSRRLWLAHLVMQASARLGFDTQRPEMPATLEPVGFAGETREAWRDALASITALGDAAATRSGAPAGRISQLYWQISVDAEGRLKKVSPFERTLGARGWSQPKPLSLAKVKNHPKPAPHDAALVRCIERSPYSGSTLVLDEGAAVRALVRHPAVVFDDAPEQLIDLSEALPELEVSRIAGPGGECFSFRIQPPLRAAHDGVDGGDYRYADDFDKAQRRAGLRIVRDTPERARLICITAAHRRVAELLAQEWAVPVDARSELDAALRVLSEHFQIHSDAAAGREVAGDSRLRARLVPQGEALQLRLVVMPFGEFGPCVTPGVGRERLMAAHEGERLTTRRALADERAHWQAVLDALPFLDDGAAPDSGWLLDDPEQALHAVEVLPKLPAVVALDWPRGRALRVSAVDRPDLGLHVASGRDWFALEGELRVDETRVLGLQQLLELARGSRKRFVALGEGAYLALSDSLRRQLADLDAAGRADQGTLKLPAAAAAWLEATLEGASVSGDPGWSGRIAALAQAAELDPVVDGLQAELRGYQVEGFAWMARLAHAGLGACLADDMGLGKTVQTLALLSRRGAEGPALVLAPTSVCANWQIEARRFAPALNPQLYGELDDAGRQALVEQAGPRDLVIASYALAQIDNERLASRAWTTLVLDEAQALKNAATRRARAVAGFEAGFRLALTGTPVENHLSDLWSIMNLVNPGLLGTAHQFGERFAGPIEKQRDGAARQRLRRLVSPFLLRRTKAQVLPDLPARTEIIRRVEPPQQERAFLEALRRSAAERVEALSGQDGEGTSFHVLAELMRLRRAACDPRLVAPEFGMVGAKLQEFEQIVRELVEGQHKALVFSQFTDFLKLLGERLREIGVTHQYLDGAIPAAERARRVQAFQRGEGELFLISLKAGGFGLNLTAADYVLIVDPWWNPAAEDQAMGRAHRIGQQRPVTVYRLVTAGSIEERIVTLHHDKRSLAEGILEGQENAEALSAEALRELLLGP